MASTRSAFFDPEIFTRVLPFCDTRVVALYGAFKCELYAGPA